MIKEMTRTLERDEIIRARDWCCWLPPDGWTRIENGSIWIGCKVADIKSIYDEQILFRRDTL